MKTEMKLARAFKTLAEQGEQIDSTASAVLAIVKGAGTVNEERFEQLIAGAYEANGWNHQVGRPANGEERGDAAPNTVRTYVTIMRRALGVGLRIGRYDTFNALRTALDRKAQPRLVRQGRKGRKGGKRGAAAVVALPTNGADMLRIPKDIRQDFVGVAIADHKAMNGALFHDLAATFAKLNPENRAEMGRELSALLHKWLPAAGVPSIARRAGNGNGRTQERKAA